MSKRRRKKDQNHGDNERWLITYSDLITLLLVFFIVLYSMSQIQNEKFNALVDSLKTAFNGNAILTESSIKSKEDQNTDSLSMPVTQVPQQKTKNNNNNAQLDKLYKQLQSYIDKNHLQNVLSLENLQRGVQLTLKEQILFDLGKADIKSQAKPILERVGGILNTVPNDISVEGHTDNNPISGGKYKSNWELSGARSLTVMYFLMNKDHLAAGRLHFAGYGQYKPVAPNDTPEHQSLNRRVNIIVLRNDTAK